MPANDPTPGEIYIELLNRLREINATALADEIERTVARGVVMPEQETDYYQKKSTVLRPMTDDEKLATGIEFLVTASEIPIMLSKVRMTLGNSPVKWLPERPGTEREEALAAPIEDLGEVALQKATDILKGIIGEAAELKLQLPEVA